MEDNLPVGLNVNLWATIPGNNYMAVGNNATAWQGDNSVAFGDDVSASGGEVVVGKTLFGTEIPDDVKTLVEQNAQQAKWIVTIVANYVRDYYQTPKNGENNKCSQCKVSGLRILLPDGRIAKQVGEEKINVQIQSQTASGLPTAWLGSERLIKVKVTEDRVLSGYDVGKHSFALDLDSQNAKTKEERIREAALRYCEVKGLDPNAWAASGDMVAIGYRTPKILDGVIREMERLQDTILMQKCLESST